MRPDPPVGSFEPISWGTPIELDSTVPVGGLTAPQILSRAALVTGWTLALRGGIGPRETYIGRLAVTAGLAVIAGLVRRAGACEIARDDAYLSAGRTSPNQFAR